MMMMTGVDDYIRSRLDQDDEARTYQFRVAKFRKRTGSTDSENVPVQLSDSENVGTKKLNENFSEVRGPLEWKMIRKSAPKFCSVVQTFGHFVVGGSLERRSAKIM